MHQLFTITLIVSGFFIPSALPQTIFESATHVAEYQIKPQEKNCTPAAIHEFPSDGLTRDQRRNGWIVIHVLLTAYCFIILSIICDDYFVPAIETLVKRLELSEDVAGASFMAITSASPELFINCVGTFITEGDIGVGTVVGSNVFNILAAPACCGLFAKMAFQFEYWSILRDGLMYAISVIMLIATLYDDKVFWYEALAFVLAYFGYIAVMYYDRTIRKKLNKCAPPTHPPPPPNHELEKQIPQITTDNHLIYDSLPQVTDEDLADKTNDTSKETKQASIWVYPANKSLGKKAWWVLNRPIVFAMKYTVPNCERHPILYPLTLVMCMFWIGSTSYLLAWLITAIGDTISIPDSVMGLSFLAVGSSMPEIVTCIIVSKQGHGIMGMSSALGANTFEVLLCLGLPWLIKTCFNPKVPGSHWIDINSSGLAYNATCLLSTLVFLYICLCCNGFRLDWKVGLICLIMYAVFLVVGTLIELNVFFQVNPPMCM